MSTYNPTPFDEFRALKDDLEIGLTADGLLNRESVVKTVVTTLTGKDDARGIPGTASDVKTEIVPRPKVELKTQIRWVDGVPLEIGDAKLTITRSVPEATLTAASWFEIDGARFTRVDGGLQRDTNGLDWTLVLKRERT